MTPYVIAVVGTPGSGKSTLCSSLASWLASDGAVVDHFVEDEILTREPFRPVAEEFDGGRGTVRPQTLVEATRAYVEQARSDGVDILVTDALIPYVPSLLAWGHDEEAITSVARRLEEAVGPAEVSVVVVRDDTEVALRRAAVREGPRWLEGFIAKLGGSPGAVRVTDLPTAAAHLQREIDLTLRVLARTSWHVVTVDVDGRDAAGLHKDVQQQLPFPR